MDIDVKNASAREGDEVVEVYLTFPKSPIAPKVALRGLSRVHLGAGETRHVNLTLQPRDLSEVNEAGDRVIAAGVYRASVGGGQPGTSAPVAEAEFSIHGEQKLPE
jgi:beta-glucosidase